MIENRLDLPKLECRFIEIHKTKCINNIPISFFNKDKLHLIENLDQDLIKYTYCLYKNIFFNILHPSEITYTSDDGIQSERKIFTSEFTSIENRLFDKLKEPYINVRTKLNNRSEMSYFFNEFLEDILVKHNVIHVINKDIYNLMKYVYYGYKTSTETNKMNLLIPVNNRDVVITVDSDRSYNLSENFFNLSLYWRMIHLFDRSKEDKDFFISLVLNTFINKNYTNRYHYSSMENKQSKISVAEFILLNYIKINSQTTHKHLKMIFNDHIKKISSEVQIVDYNVLNLFLLHNKNKYNISYPVNEILKDICKKYPIFNFNVTTEAEEDEIVLDDDPTENQNSSTKDTTDQNSDDLALKSEPEEGDDDTSDDDNFLDNIPELRDDATADNTPDDESISDETTPLDDDAEKPIDESDDELSVKEFLTKRKIDTLNQEIKNNKMSNSDTNILNQWCKKHLWCKTIEQSLILLKTLKIKLP